MYNLEGWEIAGVEYTVSGLVKSPTGDTDLVDCSGSFGYIEDSLSILHCSIAIIDTGGEHLLVIFIALAIRRKTYFASIARVQSD